MMMQKTKFLIVSRVRAESFGLHVAVSIHVIGICKNLLLGNTFVVLELATEIGHCRFVEKQRESTVKNLAGNPNPYGPTDAT